MISYTLINETVFAMIEAFFILLIYKNMVKIEKYFNNNSLRSFIFISFYTIFSYWSSNYIPIGFHTLLILILSTITLVLLTNIDVKQSLLIMLIFAIIIMICEGVILSLFIYLKNTNTAEIVNNPVTKFQFSVMAKLLQSILIMSIGKSKKIRFNKTFYNNSHLFLFIFLGIFLLGLVIYSIDYSITIGTNLVMYQVLLILIFFSFIGLGYIVFNEQKKSWTIKEKLRLQDEHIKNTESIINIIRKEKHDFANHINTIYALCTLDIDRERALKRIKAYLDKLSYDLKSSYHFYNTGNEYIDALLAIKSNHCYENNIHLDVDLEASLENISIDSNNLVSVISNIIDNALEAHNSIANTNIKKIISIHTFVENNNFYISISNNGPKIPKDKMNRIFDNGYSTKTYDKDEHGLGLYIIKQIIKKYKGEIFVSSTDYETEFLIRLNLNGINSTIATSTRLSNKIM